SRQGSTLARRTLRKGRAVCFLGARRQDPHGRHPHVEETRMVLLNPWSTPSPKKPLPMSLLALGSMLDGEFEYTIVDGNVEPDAAGAIIAIADKRPIAASALPWMPG